MVGSISKYWQTLRMMMRVEHDVFVCSAGVSNLGDGKCDALGERWSGASAERGLELGRARVMVGGNHEITRGWWQELELEEGEA